MTSIRADPKCLSFLIIKFQARYSAIQFQITQSVRKRFFRAIKDKCGVVGILTNVNFVSFDKNPPISLFVLILSANISTQSKKM